uniref:cupin domain-containing protein n=1 Tax=Saccharopolyspora galaxeae TaxID=2781241 RepID=UPI001F1B2A92|nr:cupin domain-containing protein [Saccharopolyspora sp. HNM0986]
MVDAVIVADLNEPSDIHGMHSGEGLARWKVLARRGSLFGYWEAVEWSALPPGGVSGEHIHSRTEELYFIVSGDGEMTLNGRTHQVRPGHLIVNGLGTRHGLRNTGDEELVWLVIEVSGPHTAAVLDTPRETPRHEPERTAMSDAVVIDLRQAGQVDTTEHLTGPLRLARLVRLRPGEPLELSADSEEHTVYTIGGQGRARGSSETVALRSGVGLTLPLGGTVSIEAASQREPLELFVVSLAVPGAAGGRQ